MTLDKGDTRLILAACKEHGLLRNQAAYVLATALHETAHTMKPVRETLAPTDAKAKERLTKAWKSGKLKWVKSDYWSGGFFGRGYVQLTHRANDVKAGEELGIPLAERPSLALEPEVAVQVLVRGMKEGWFTGKKLADYITLKQSDYAKARQIVNGMDRAADIADMAGDYDALLKNIGYGEGKPQEPAKPLPAPSPAPKAETPPVAAPDEPATATKGIAGLIFGLVLAAGAAILAFLTGG
jgi:predicted chitinase